MKKAESSSFNLSEYRLPNDSGIIKFYPRLLRQGAGINFDICDYEMLFADEATKGIIREGKTIGCFYIESPGMRSLLRRLEVDTFPMLTAASSVIRPGVAESGMMQEFIARHKNPKLRKYLVPEMEQILGETYGVMIYQEDVLKVAHHIGGLTLEEADVLRRAMSGKMRSRDAMAKLHARFTESAQKKGHSQFIINELWRQIESFAGYAFCKAHSASFALLSFQVAYLKVHYPAEFIAAVLSNGGGYYSAAVYIQEAKRLGLSILPPCVNHSMYEYEGNQKQIRIGFMAIKGMSSGLAAAIVHERQQHGKFVSLADFIVRTRAGYQSSALLIRCGAMDCFGKTRPTLMRHLDIYFRFRKILEQSVNNLFAHESFRLEQEVETMRDYSIEEKCSIELELFDFMITRHPLEFFPGALAQRGVISADAMHRFAGKKVSMVGWYMSSKRIRTKKGEIMKFLSLEDLTGTFEAVIFPKAYARCAEKTLSMGPFMLTGVIDKENTVNIIVDTLDVLSVKDISADKMWDSAENKYYGEDEKITDEEIMLVETLGRDELVRAYLGSG